MSIHQQSREDLELQVKSLYREVLKLRKYKQALQAQEKLFRSILTMRNVSTGRLMLRSILLEIVDFTVKLMNADGASLFILTPDGLITESILARGPTIETDKTKLIGQVLNKGLAGWVVRYRQIAVIEDTWNDDRWLELPEQPYDVRSAIAIPLLRGKLLLGVLTLTNTEPNKFTPDLAEFMEMYSPSLTIALDQILMYLQDHDKDKDTIPKL